MHTKNDCIAQADALTLDGLFRARANRTPDALAYRYFDDHRCEWLTFT